MRGEQAAARPVAGAGNTGDGRRLSGRDEGGQLGE
jgi:hypothetical protein